MPFLSGQSEKQQCFDFRGVDSYVYIKLYGVSRIWFPFSLKAKNVHITGYAHI